MELKTKNSLIISGKGILEATKKGTRKYENGILTPGEVVYRVENPNIICNEGLVLAAGFFIDESAVYDVGITYCEIGTGSNAPAVGDVTLTAFHHRNQITTRSRATYEDTFATFFTSFESTCAIKEAGMWGGSDAAAGVATGLLFSHFLVTFDNGAGAYDITISYLLTCARG